MAPPGEVPNTVPTKDSTDTEENQAKTGKPKKEAEQNDDGQEVGVPTTDETNTSSLIVPGSVSVVKNMYQTKKDSDGQWKWIETLPEDIPETEEIKEKAKYAIVIGNIKNPDPESTRTLQAQMIIIQSSWLKKALGSYILKSYPGVTCELSKLEFNAPFTPFVHRWAELLKYRSRPNLDPTMAKHIDLLHDALKKEIGEQIELYEDYIFTGVITFVHLWMIFQPGGTIISEAYGALSAYELLDSEYIKNDDGEFLRLKCEYINWSGSYFGRSAEIIDLPKFHGTKRIEDLGAFPLKFHGNSENVKRELIERGEKFESLAGYQYQA